MLRDFEVWIEKDDRPEYHPFTVTVWKGSGYHRSELAEFSGKRLKPLLDKAAKAMEEDSQKD